MKILYLPLAWVPGTSFHVPLFLFSVPCLKILLSKGLGLGIVAGSVLGMYLLFSSSCGDEGGGLRVCELGGSLDQNRG